MKMHRVALGLAVIAAGIAPSAAQAKVVNCNGGGLVSLEGHELQYDDCTTNLADGKGDVAFSNGGLTMTMTAQYGPGSQETAAAWQSNGALPATKSVCVTVSVADPSSSPLTVDDAISYNEREHHRKSKVTVSGEYTFCRKVPKGAENVWTQLLVSAKATRRAALSEATITINGLSFT